MIVRTPPQIRRPGLDPTESPEPSAAEPSSARAKVASQYERAGQPKGWKGSESLVRRTYANIVSTPSVAKSPTVVNVDSQRQLKDSRAIDLGQTGDSLLKTVSSSVPTRSFSFSFGDRNAAAGIEARKGSSLESNALTQNLGVKVGKSPSTEKSRLADAQKVSAMSNESTAGINRTLLNDFVDRLCRAHPDPAEAHALLMQFLTDGVMLIGPFLPPVGENALGTAIRYWNSGAGSPKDLDAARVACWEFLDAKGSNVAIKDEEDAAMRALLCVLQPSPRKDAHPADVANWFANMLDRIDDYSEYFEFLMMNDDEPGKT